MSLRVGNFEILNLTKLKLHSCNRALRGRKSISHCKTLQPIQLPMVIDGITIAFAKAFEDFVRFRQNFDKRRIIRKICNVQAMSVIFKLLVVLVVTLKLQTPQSAIHRSTAWLANQTESFLFATF